MMEATFLQNIWFFLFFVLIAGYAILDGFDLGVGVLSLFNRSDDERRLYVNAIAPVWDGNEVWLLTGGGALFAAFPPVYATVFSGFYLALMLVLLGLIARAVSMEFRGRIESGSWRRFWDGAFGIGSLLPLILLYSPAGKSRPWIGVACLLVIIGGLAQMYGIIIGGQAWPMEMFPGKEVSSTFFDGVINDYTPSVYEIALGLGGVAVSLVLVAFIIKVLPFLPSSLADNK